MKIEVTLQKLKERYYRPVIAHPGGHLGHHGDCNIWSEHHQCSCGFIHDLDVIDFADKLYEKYHEDYRKSLGLKKPTDEQIKAITDVLDGIFTVRTFEDEEIDEEEWQLIENIFGVEFRQRREKEWAVQSEKI